MKTENLQLFDKWFVGRQDQLDEFKRFVSGEKDYRILFINGPGGIGKTWLLRKMLETVQEMDKPDLVVGDELVDMYSTSNHRVDGVQSRIINLMEETLGKPVFMKFRQMQRELEVGLQEDFDEGTLQQMRRNLEQAFFDDCRRLAETKAPVLFFDTFERVQRDPVGRWIMTDFTHELPQFRIVIASRERWGGDGIVHSYPLQGLTVREAADYFSRRGLSMGQESRTLLNALHEKANGHPLLIELAIEWLRGDLLRDSKALSELSKYAFREEMVAPLREMGRGLFGDPELDEAIHQTILFMAYFNRRFNTNLLGRLADRAVVDLRGFSPADVVAKLEEGFFFVKARPDGYIQLHDEMEALVDDYLWPTFDRTGALRRELAQIACDWYDDQISRSTNETLKEDLFAEQLIYRLDVDLEQASQQLNAYPHRPSLNYLLVTEIRPERVREFPVDYQGKFAADLGARAKEVFQYELAQEYWNVALDVAGKNDDLDRQIDILVSLHNCTYQIDLNASLEILERALQLSEQREDKRPRVLYEIGFTYRRLEQIEEAIDWYERAREEASKLRNKEMMPTILNDMGYGHVFLGNYARAGHLVKTGLELRQEQLKTLEQELARVSQQVSAGKDDVFLVQLRARRNDLRDAIREARRKVGWSFNTLGQVKRFDGDLAAATGAYSEALSIFQEINDFGWIARALHSRAEAHRRIAATLYEQDREEARKEYERRAQDDVQNCLELCDQYGLDNEKHTANRRMGRLLHDQALRANTPKEKLSLLDRAHRHFIEGVEIARQEENVLEELENLTELAFLVDDRLEALKRIHRTLSAKEIEENKEAITSFREGLARHKEDKPRIHQFPVFENLLKLEEGAFHFVIGEHSKALKLYLRGFVGLANTPGYGTARYRQHLDHLFKQIQRLNDPEIEWQWCKTFIETWNKTLVEDAKPSQTLAQAHPELVERMQLYLDTAFMFRE